MVHARRSSRARHLVAFRAAPAQRPLAVHVLAPGDCRQNKLPVIRHAGGYRHDVDVPIGDQRRPAGIRLGNAERVRSLVGRFLLVGRKGSQREAAQALHGRHVRIAGPPATGICPYNPDTQRFSHGHAPSQCRTARCGRAHLN